MSLGEEFQLIVKLRIHCKCCTFFKVDVGSFNWSYHFIYGYLVDNHAFLLTNFIAII